ncbi:AaceriACL026Wp [[Ashbya] aceris (nom. inval.)]|nr:AaceriACL026Wp [[Ashbya] aceris (nom. inval.)]
MFLRIDLRTFTTMGVLRKTGLKAKLSAIQAGKTAVPLSKQEVRAQQEKRQLMIKRIQKAPYTRQQAIHILEKQYGFRDAAKTLELGPLSAKDTDLLQRTTDKRLIYTILGVSGEQLRDSKLVADDVLKFCKRGMLNKALLLIRLAKKNGVVGMNVLMRHYCEVEQSASSAVLLYQHRSKWGIPPNEHTATILFSGIARIKKPLSKQNAAKVINIVQGMIEQRQLNAIHFNAALSCLARCSDTKYLLECFELMPSYMARSKIAYTELLEGIAKIEDDIEAMQKLDYLMTKLPIKSVNAKTLFYYLNVWNMRGNPDLSKCTLVLCDRFFDVGVKFELPVPKGVQLPSLDTWGLVEKLPLNEHVLGIFLENCAKHGLFALATKVYERVRSDHPDILDEKSYHHIMQINREKYPTSCLDRNLEVFEHLREALGKVSVATLRQMHRSMARVLTKRYIYDDPTRLEETMEKIQTFFLNYDSTSLHGKRVLNLKQSTVYWSILKDTVSSEKLTLPRKKIMSEQFIQSYNSDLLRLKHASEDDRARLRAVYLTAVRFFSAYQDNFTLSVEDVADLPQDSLQSQQFHFRKLLSRFKKRILEELQLLEKKQPIPPSLIEGTKRLGDRIFTTPVPGALQKE